MSECDSCGTDHAHAVGPKSYMRECISVLISQRDEARKKVAALVALMGNVQWIRQSTKGMPRYCPWCDQDETESGEHRVDCLAAFSCGWKREGGKDG